MDEPWAEELEDLERFRSLAALEERVEALKALAFCPALAGNYSSSAGDAGTSDASALWDVEKWQEGIDDDLLWDEDRESLQLLQELQNAEEHLTALRAMRESVLRSIEGGGGGGGDAQGRLDEAPE